MSPSIQTRFAIWLSFLVLAIAPACSSAPSPTPLASPTATSTRFDATPASTPVLLSFPTVPPPTPTPSGITPTLSAPVASGGRGSSLPVVQIVSPISNTQISISQTLYVIAFATSENGVSKIELSDDGTLVRTEVAPPSLPTFSAVIPWTPAQTGGHILRLVSYDASNTPSLPEEIMVLVTPDSRRPTSTIIYPIGIPQIEIGTILQVYSTGTDEASVSQLDLLVDNQIYTYVTAPSGVSQPIFSTVFAWPAATPGNHTLVVRTHDNMDQTTDSGALKVFVVDTHAPTISVSIDHTNALVGEPVTVTVSALDISGIQRVELWTSREITNTVTSVAPARQTSLSTQFTWQQSSPGDYVITARAYNASGVYKESPPQTVSVLRQGQATPTRPVPPTPTRTRTPRPQPTPRIQPPPPPVADITQPTDHFTAYAPLRIIFSAQGSAELLRVELWGYYLGQINPQIICTIDAKATTQKAGQCDWTTNSAGAVALYAQTTDIYGQLGRSPLISGYILPPALPTPTVPPISLAGRWTATLPTGTYSANFRPIVTASGTALRGDFRWTGTISATTPTIDLAGRITSGTAKSDRVTFHIDFTPAPAASTTPAADTPVPTAVPTSTPPAPGLDFDCVPDPVAMTLDCKFKDARGQTGTALFKREGSP